MQASLLFRSLVTRTAVCLVCGSRRLRRSTRMYGALMRWLGFVAIRCQECSRRFPLRRRVGATRITIHGGLPCPDPEWEGVAVSIREALWGIPGTWCVDVACGKDGRWLVTARRVGNVLRLSLVPGEDAAARVHEGLKSVIEKEGLAL